MQDLNLLRSFLAVYRIGTITEAARVLHLSQPAVTAHVQALERQLRTQLFTRQPRRGVLPTVAGHALARRVAPHVDALDSADMAACVADVPPVRFGGPRDFLATLVIPLLSPLIADGMRIEARSDDRLDVIAAVASGELDVAIGAGAVSHRGVEVIPLFDKQIVLAGTPAWAQRVDPEAVTRSGVLALAGLPLLAYSRDMPGISAYFKALSGAVAAVEPALIFDDLRALVTATRLGAGVTALPRFYIADDLTAGTLVELHRPRRIPAKPVIAAIHPANADPRVEKIIAALRAGTPPRQSLPAEAPGGPG